MRRRAFLAGAGAASVGLAGCTRFVPGTGGGGTADTLRVGTYQAFVDAPSTSAGEWVKTAFEERTGKTLEWVVRENELNEFIQRRQRGAPMEADAYLGVTPQDLVRADATLDDDTPLFEGLDTSQVENVGNVEDAFRFDPQNRVLPTGASYVCLVYDEGAVEAPTSFDDLLGEAYADSLLLANPESTATGLLFLLWSLMQKGADSYLDYWRRLLDNGVRVLGSWSDAYAAYSEGEAPMVVSFSTDQVYAAAEDQPMSRHQIAFLENQGYAYVDGIGKFATTERDDLVNEFTSFLLQPEVQRETAVKNVGIPTVSNASLPEEYQQYVKVPEEPVQYGYEELAANMQSWRDEWARMAASQ
ncbi:thiamine ABC transporter substrate binding subunit [Halobium salinum]|uniref:Thiamine ABC transporter substrate binding subunit n=1 Tax=Halobium salinum TaxID=1364940 RepID=A0ABD5PAN7_9EURY